MAVCALFWFGLVIAIIGLILAIIGSVTLTSNQNNTQAWMQWLFWGGIILIVLGMILIFIDLFREPKEARCEVGASSCGSEYPTSSTYGPYGPYGQAGRPY